MHLASALDLQEVPDEVCGHVHKLELDYDVIINNAIGNDDAESWRELVKEAKARWKESLEGAGRVIPPGRAKDEGSRGAPQEVAVQPSEPTLERAEAFAEVAGIMADRHPKVKQFRRMHLRDRLLTDREAREFLDRRCNGPLPTRHGAKAVARKLWTLAETLSKTYLWRETDAV